MKPCSDDMATIVRSGWTPKPPAAPATRATNPVSRRRVMLGKRAGLEMSCHLQTQRPTKRNGNGQGVAEPRLMLCSRRGEAADGRQGTHLELEGCGARTLPFAVPSPWCPKEWLIRRGRLTRSRSGLAMRTVSDCLSARSWRMKASHWALVAWDCAASWAIRELGG